MFRVAQEDEAERLGADLGLRVKAHDSNRVQWVATVPLADPGETRKCEIKLELAIPERIWQPHDPWKRLFVRTRLGSPRLWTGAEELLTSPSSVQMVHRQALCAVHELKNAGAEVRSRLSKLARDGAELDKAASKAICDRLQRALTGAFTVRERLEDVDSADIIDEARLASEYVSTEVLRLVTRVREGLQGEWRQRPGRGGPVAGEVAPVHALITETLANELAGRRERDYVVAVADKPATVDQFVHRAGLLKRHFQQALFLDASVTKTDEKLGNWIAGFVAVLASSWYFVWQVYYLNEAMQMGQTVVSLVMAGGVAGLLYAVKDRIKELGRRYVSRLLKDMYADREVRLNLRDDFTGVGRRLAIARETIRNTTRYATNTVDGDLSGMQRYRVLHIRDVVVHRGGLDLRERGITSLKHVVRYDLSALFSSVDDVAKSVVIQHGDTMHTVHKRRAYRLPVRASLFIDDARLPIIERFGELVIRGRKLRVYRSTKANAGVWTASDD